MHQELVFINHNSTSDQNSIGCSLAKPRINIHLGRLRLIFHSVGLSCLGGAVFLQVLVFKDILQRGVFVGVEKNPIILQLEVALTIFAAVYLVHLYISKIRSLP
jgi:hypothetical protein